MTPSDDYTPQPDTVKGPDDSLHPGEAVKPPTVSDPVRATPISPDTKKPADAAAPQHLDTPTYNVREGRVPIAPGYEILDEIGRGGMGIVFKARQAALNRIVAMKAIKDAEGASPAELSRFIEEAEAVAAIDHTNVVRVFDYGEHQRRPYLVMEYLPGSSLAARIVANGCFPPRDAAQLISKIAQGVQAAHSLGIVHRDLKPHNILFDAADEPKITDFGLSRRMHSGDRTLTGAVIGTPEYMAPEQASGQAKYAGAAADVWALGVMLYECLTGMRPFVASPDQPRPQQVMVIMKQIEFDTPISPRELASNIPHDLELICLKCLEKKPQNRYKSAAALVDDLQRFLNLEPVSVRDPWMPERVWKWSTRHKALAALYSVLILATVGSLVTGFWVSNQLGVANGKAQAADIERQRAQELAATQLYYRTLSDLRDRQAHSQPGWTANGIKSIQQLMHNGLPTTAHLAELRTEAAHRFISVDLSEPKELIKGIDAATLAIHPKGDWVALGQSKAQGFVFCNIVLIRPQTGEVVRRLSFAPSFQFELEQGVQDGPRTCKLSPDGRWLLVGTRSGLIHWWDLNDPAATVTSANGHKAEVTQIIAAPDSSCFYTGSKDGAVYRWFPGSNKPSATGTLPGPVQTLQLLPGGHALACGAASEIHTLKWDTLKPVAARRPLRAGRLAIIPSTGLWIVADGSNLQLIDPRIGSDRPVRTLRAADQEHAHNDNVRHLSLSPDGTLLATSSIDHHVRIWNLVGRRLLIDIPIDLGLSGAIEWDPAGRSIIVAAANRVLRYDIKGQSGQLQLPLGTAARGVAWSTDGQLLAGVAAHQADAIDEMRLWETGSITPGRLAIPKLKKELLPTHRIGTAEDAPKAISFAPDNQQLAVRTKRGIAIYHTATGDERQLLPVKDPSGLSWSSTNQIWATVGTKLISWNPDLQQGPSWSNGLATLITGKGSVYGVAAGPNTLAVCCRSGMVSFLRPADASLVGSWIGKSSVQCIALAPDESLAAIGTESGEVRLLRVPTGEALFELTNAHREAVTTVAFITNQLIVTGCQDGTVRLWSWRDRRLKEVYTLRTTGAVIDLAVSPDCHRLAAAVSGELGIRVWQLDAIHEQLKQLGLDPL